MQWCNRYKPLKLCKKNKQRIINGLSMATIEGIGKYQKVKKREIAPILIDDKLYNFFDS